MSKIAIITDTHFGARNDLVPLMENQTRFFHDIFFPTLREHQVTTVLHGGDYTDKRKYVNYGTAQWIYQNYRQPMRDMNIQEYALVGNHDCFLKHSTEINSIQELYRDDESVHVVRTPFVFNCGNDKGCSGPDILMLPWICDENRGRSIDLLKNSKASIVLGHLEIAGFSMYRGVPNHEGLDPALFDRFELVMSGHFHHRSTAGPIVYLGAAYPMTWSDYNDSRGFHLFDTEDRTLTFIENPYSIFNRLVYDDTNKPNDYINGLCHDIIAANSPYRESFVKVVVRAKTQPYWFDLMMDSLYKVNALDVQIVDDIFVNEDEIQGELSEEPPTDTINLMREYIDTLSINADKAELLKYLTRLYHEALEAHQSSRFA